eukprot:CAMPEP_0170308058 /NCGR_PEP_ID=MMETSP0116_2-20130129/54460_1 /TAXON_ID=400756 /ORGANISM="Durinskia baltica, Strain CSIRO CS-38" /LENGTH=61 /DNA_ID=CAMNT_0010560223 /DNA_START=36 /DNA_END=217 /DNA_ORIENTATION=-
MGTKILRPFSHGHGRWLVGEDGAFSGDGQVYFDNRLLLHLASDTAVELMFDELEVDADRWS